MEFQDRIDADQRIEPRDLADAHHGARVGPYEQRVSGTWFMIAAPSPSQPIAATSGREFVG